MSDRPILTGSVFIMFLEEVRQWVYSLNRCTYFTVLLICFLYKVLVKEFYLIFLLLLITLLF